MLADLQRARARSLVAQGAIAAQDLDRAEAAAEVAAREEQIARGELAAGLKALREAAEDAAAELARRRASLRAAEAAGTAAEAACATAVQEEQRVRAQCRPEQLVSAQRLVTARDTALTAAVARRGETDARRAEIMAKQLEGKRLAAQIAVLRRRLRGSVLRSPVDGVVTTPRVEDRVGRHFDKGDTICAIEVPTLMSARISIPEKEMGVVTVGAPVYLKVAAFPEQTFAGKVTEIAPIARRRGNEVTCEVRIRVPNPGGLLRPEMSGWAKIACGKKPVGVLLTRRLTRYLRTEAWSWF
jgi:multidrug efflux pump subunit AcrA (membrane-fusion protein)